MSRPRSFPASRFLPVLLVLALFPSPARAEETVAQVEIRGNELLKPGFIRTHIPIREGQPYSQAQVEEAIQELDKLGLFAEGIKADKEPTGAAGQIRVVFTVKERLVLRSLSLEGRHTGFWSWLRNAFDPKVTAWEGALSTLREGEKEDDANGFLKKGTFLHPEDLKRLEQELKRKLVDRGYWDPKIGYEVIPGDHLAGVTFRVDAGPRSSVWSIRFEGNKAFTKGKILAKLDDSRPPKEFKTSSWWWIFNNGAFDWQTWQDDLEKVEKFYKGEGFLDARIDRLGGREMSANGKWIYLTVRVQEGPRYTLKDLKIEGHTLYDEEKIREKIRSVPGGLYMPRQVEEDIDRIQLLYGEKGHLYVRVEPVPVYHDDKSVSLTLRIDEGRLVYLRRLEFRGNTDTRDKVLRREFTLVPGEWVRLAELKTSYRRLNNLGFFKEVEPPDFLDTEEESQKDLVVRVKEADTGKISLGVGYSSENDIVGSLIFHQRNFDITRLDRFPLSKGGGEDLRISAEPGTRTSRYALDFFEPWFLNHPVGLGVGLFYQQRNYVSYLQENYGVDVTFTRRIPWDITLGTTVRNEEYKISRVSEDAPGSIRDSEGRTPLHSLNPFVTIDKRDSPWVPTSGWRWRTDYEYAGGPLGGVDFHKTTTDLAYHIPVWEDRDERRHVLSLRGNFGWVEPHHNTQQVPVFERFFAGGPSTIRGFRFRSVGPTANDEPVGGDYRLLTTAEYTFPLAGRSLLRGALFVDRGTVHDDIHGDMLADMRSSWGVGLRVSIPGFTLAPLSFDFAFPLEIKDGDSRQTFSFSLSGVF